MGSQDHQDIIDNIKTLNEAKQIILHLIESQEAINTVLGYELRTPLMAIKGYAGLAQREDLAEEYPYFLKIIIQHTERIERLIAALRIAIRIEQYQHQKSLLENFPLEIIDPNPTLAGHISQIQRNIELENEIRVLQNEVDQRKVVQSLPKTL